jgi:uncharacterized delta-60 repeat protein
MAVYNDLAQVLTSNNTMSVFYDDNMSFGDTTKGIVNTSINSENNLSTCSAVDFEDRIVVGGFDVVGESVNDFLLCRYNPDGSLDTTFGTGGKVTTDITGNVDYTSALVIDSQNRIIVCGYTDLSGTGLDKITVLRYKVNGDLDTTFGDDENGIVVLSIRNTKNSSGNALTLDSQDRILVSGYTDTSGNVTYFAIIRLTNSGVLDTTFNGNGKVETDIRYDISGLDMSGNNNYATGIVVDSQDRIVVSGITENDINNTVLSTNPDFVVVRYTESGQLDTTFGPQQTGIVVTDIYNNSDDGTNTMIAIDSKDRIVLGGTTESYGTNSDFAVVRYDSSGNLDLTFGTNGIQITDICGNDYIDYANAMVIDAQDRIVLVGSSTVESIDNFAIVRYNVNGSVDTSFGESGFVVTDVADGDNSTATSVLIDSHNKIVVGGSGYYSTEIHFVIARYNDNGELDTEDRFYNKISIDGGSTWKPINNYNKFKSHNYKNLLLIPNIDSTSTQYTIKLKTTNGTQTNSIILPNQPKQQATNVTFVQQITNIITSPTGKFVKQNY